MGPVITAVLDDTCGNLIQIAHQPVRAVSGAGLALRGASRAGCHRHTAFRTMLCHRKTPAVSRGLGASASLIQLLQCAVLYRQPPYSIPSYSIAPRAPPGVGEFGAAGRAATGARASISRRIPILQPSQLL